MRMRCNFGLVKFDDSTELSPLDFSSDDDDDREMKSSGLEMREIGLLISPTECE